MSITLTAIALAAALAAPDVFTDPDGCRWIRKDALQATVKKPRPFLVQFAKPASAPASAPKKVKPKAKKRNFLPRPIPNYDLIGCDEDGGVKSLIPAAPVLPPQAPPIAATPVDMDRDYVNDDIVPVAVPTVAQIIGTPADYTLIGPVGGPSTGPAVVLGAPPPGITPAVPEPETWALLAAGAALLARRKRHG